jgi:hypothetical protein
LFNDNFESKGFLEGKWDTDSAHMDNVEKYAGGKYSALLKGNGHIARKISTVNRNNIRISYASNFIFLSQDSELKCEWYDGVKWNLLEDVKGAG